MVSFLPDTSRDEYGNITIDFGERFENVILVLKRVDFGGVITIEVKIQQLMTKTLIDSKKQDYDADANIAQWKALGQEAYKTDPVKYENAELGTLEGYLIDGNGVVEVNDCLISVDTFEGPNGTVEISSTVTGIRWHSDLPCLREHYSGSFFPMRCEKLIEWTGKLPNLENAGGLFDGCTGLTEWTVALPNSITTATNMFQNCSKLDSWTVALPNSITDAYGMFYGCTGLMSFASDMPSGLTTDAQYMFYECCLDITSVERISRTIAECNGASDYAKTIHLGVSSECHGDTNYDTYINRMKGKGWIVVCTVNGSSHTH